MTNKIKKLIGNKKGIYRKINSGATHLEQQYRTFNRLFTKGNKKAKRNNEIRIENEAKDNQKAFY